MTYCLTCDAEKHPVQTFTMAGIVSACPTCEAVFERPTTEAATPQPQSVNVAPAPVAPPLPKPPSGEPTAWSAILDETRARLAFCEEQIAQRDAYIEEAAMLRRMLDAAERETKPVLSAVLTN